MNNRLCFQISPVTVGAFETVLAASQVPLFIQINPHSMKE